MGREGERGGGGEEEREGEIEDSERGRGWEGGGGGHDYLMVHTSVMHCSHSTNLLLGP